MGQMNVSLRKATPADIPRMREIIEASVRGLQAADYSPAQIDGALKSVYGVDSQLIADRTYLPPRPPTTRRASLPAAVGASARRFTAAISSPRREDSLLDPCHDAAKIRAFFVHPDWARQGIGSRILEACESAAVAAGFSRMEMGATLSGVAFYRARGYIEAESQAVAIGNGEALPIVRMTKTIRPHL